MRLPEGPTSISIVEQSKETGELKNLPGRLTSEDIVNRTPRL
jgi:hypothetical protein